MTAPLIPAGGVTIAEYNAMQATAMTEATFQAAIITAANRLGWLAYHTYDSRRSSPGFPDLVLVHPGRGLILYRELKTQTGEVTPAQHKWLNALAAAGADVAVWRPLDWFEHRIEEVLYPPEYSTTTEMTGDPR